jgi:hypothetical protein
MAEEILPDAVGRLDASIARLDTSIQRLLAERRAVAATLRAFYLAPLSAASLQPVLDLAERLNPGLPRELDAVRALELLEDDETPGTVQ